MSKEITLLLIETKDVGAMYLERALRNHHANTPVIRAGGS
jgi:hypothetical protein